MPRRGHESPEEHLYGPQETANFLGVHRSTLHLAVKRALLTPDSFTPGGHMRFRRETLEAYAAHLARQPATNSTHILADLARTLPLPDGRQAMCRLAFASIRQSVPALTMYGVAMHNPTPGDPHALAQLAQEGFTQQLHEIYTQLRPQVEFSTTAVLRTREPEICDDTADTQAMRLGTEKLVRLEGLGAYAVMPLLYEDDLLGVLVAASRRPHHFPAGEVSFLETVARDLAVALVCHGLFARQRAELATTAELTRAALARRATFPSPPAPTRDPSVATALDELLATFVNRRDAALAGLLTPAASEAMIGGWDQQDQEHVRRLQALLARVRETTAARRERWAEGTRTHTAIALSLPLASDERLVVGASWHGKRMDSATDEALLVALGGACALALGAADPPISRTNDADARH